MARILKHPPKANDTWFISRWHENPEQYRLWQRNYGTTDTMYIRGEGTEIEYPEPETGKFGDECDFVRLTPEQAQAGITCAQMGQWDRWARSFFDA